MTIITGVKYVFYCKDMSTRAKPNKTRVLTINIFCQSVRTQHLSPPTQELSTSHTLNSPPSVTRPMCWLDPLLGFASRLANGAVLLLLVNPLLVSWYLVSLITSVISRVALPIAFRVRALHFFVDVPISSDLYFSNSRSQTSE